MLNDLGRSDGGGRKLFARRCESILTSASARNNLLFGLNYRIDQDASEMLSEARRYGEFAARQARPFTAWPNTPDPERRLRVGLVSGDLRDHAIGHFLEGALAALATNVAGQVEIFAYPTHVVSDAVTDRIRASCRGWCLGRPAFGRSVRETGSR